MLTLRKTRRAITLTATSLALAVGVTLAGTGSANAAYSSPPDSTTDWFGLSLINNPDNAGGRYFYVCNYQGSSNAVYVAVAEETYGARVLLQVNGSYTTYGEVLNFNPGACDSFKILSSSPGDGLQGYITTPNFYGTGWVRYN